MKKLLTKISVKIFEYIYKKQEEAHKKRMERLKQDVKRGGTIAGKKVHASSAATLTIDNKSSETKKANQEKIEKIINSFLEQPKKFFDYIDGAGTKVYVVKKADKFLAKINEFEGFILPKQGIQALYLNLFLNKKISFETKEIFVVSSYNVNPYAIAYQFYNWYCYKMGLDGYQVEAQEKLKRVFEICESAQINSLSYSEVLELKSAVQRDIEAIEFVQKLARNKAMAKKNLDKIKKGGSANI